MTSQLRARLGMAAIVAVVATYLGYALVTARNSFGCDFSAYYTAAHRWLAGQPIYDLTVTATGTCGTYQYPPPFVLVAAPLSPFPFTAATWLWAGFLSACWIAAIALMPVRPAVRWAILLLTGISWPLVFGVRIGQVAPILLLLFVLAWRALDRPQVVGGAVALGTLVKLQPAIVALWLLGRGAWQSLTVMTGVIAAVAAAAAVVGLADWPGMVTVLRAMSDAGGAEGNVAIGAVVRQAGLDPAVAGTIQLASAVIIIALTVLGARLLPAAPGFLVAVVASQVVAPIVWTHYALILALPVAWLLDRGQWWAAGILIVQFWPIGSFVPLWAYTVEFGLALVAVVVVGRREARRPAERPRPANGATPPAGIAEPAR